MLYSSKELGEELGIPARTIRQWIDLGMPHRRDERNHIWISGREFAQWVEQVRAARKPTPLSRDQAFCLYCKQAVRLVETHRIRRGKLTLIQGVCPTCGRTINRGGHRDQVG
jgi:uncharacterized protein with PIN domain